MKLFISWSGQMSHGVAAALHQWIPYVLQTVKPFLSDRDLFKGARWSDLLAHELEDTDFGIVCITPYNVSAPWINFEAGALSKAIAHSCLMPFLFQVDRSRLQGPFSQFQLTTYEKDEILSLLVSINSQLKPEAQLDQEHLARTFSRWWPELKESLDKLLDNREGETETGYEWLYRPGDLARIEINSDCKSIWIVTPSPYQDLQMTCVRDVVRLNIDRGVRYTFIMPSSGESEIVHEMLRSIFLDHPEQLMVKELPIDTFASLAVTHYIVLNPDYCEGHKPRVLLELPIAERDYWIDVAGEAALGFAARFRKMIDEPQVTMIAAGG